MYDKELTTLQLEVLRAAAQRRSPVEEVLADFLVHGRDGEGLRDFLRRVS